MDRPAYWCPVCSDYGATVEPGPESYSESRRLFAEHLDHHTHNELTAYVWKLMYPHRPTRSEQSLEGAAVNGLTPVGQGDEL